MVVEKNKKIMGAGAAILDLLVQVDDSFIREHVEGEKGGMMLTDTGKQSALVEKAAAVSEVRHVIGGSAANTIFGLANLGSPTSFLGKVGADAEGEFYTSAYAKLGGDVSSFKVNPSLKTGRCLSLITPDSERTMRTDLAASATLTPQEITGNDFRGIDHLHMEGYLLFNMEASLHILKLAKQCGVTVSLDLASFEVVRIFRETLPEILTNYVDLVFANEDEAKEFCAVEPFDAEKAAEILTGYCSDAVVKLGKQGALLRIGGKNTRVRAEIVHALDATGAGDLWQAGFLYGYLAGLEPEICGKMGCVTGAEVVQVIGAAIPPERWDSIRKRFHELEYNKRKAGL